MFLHERRPTARKASAVNTPVRFLCLKNLADMLEREGQDARALELHVAAAEEDATDLAVRGAGEIKQDRKRKTKDQQTDRKKKKKKKIKT